MHGPDTNTSSLGYAALDSIIFDYTPDMLQHCQTMPPQAEVKPTQPPSTPHPDSGPKFCNFELDLCDWTLDSELNATVDFVWARTTGDEQDGLTGPQENYDHSGLSKDSDITCKNTFISPGHFLWASAQLGSPDTKTALSSPLYTTTQTYCLTFWFDIDPVSITTYSVTVCLSSLLQHSDGIRNLQVSTNKGEQEILIWEYAPMLDLWEQGMVQIDADTEFKVLPLRVIAFYNSFISDFICGLQG